MREKGEGARVRGECETEALLSATNWRDQMRRDVECIQNVLCIAARENCHASPRRATHADKMDDVSVHMRGVINFSWRIATR